MASIAAFDAHSGELKSGSPRLNDIMGLPSAFIVFALAEMLKVADGWISSILFDIFMTFPPLS